MDTANNFKHDDQPPNYQGQSSKLSSDLHPPCFQYGTWQLFFRLSSLLVWESIIESFEVMALCPHHHNFQMDFTCTEDFLLSTKCTQHQPPVTIYLANSGSYYLIFASCECDGKKASFFFWKRIYPPTTFYGSTSLCWFFSLSEDKVTP